jgi:hypothetical protein
MSCDGRSLTRSGEVHLSSAPLQDQKEISQNVFWRKPAFAMCCILNCYEYGVLLKSVPTGPALTCTSDHLSDQSNLPAFVHNLCICRRHALNKPTSDSGFSGRPIHHPSALFIDNNTKPQSSHICFRQRMQSIPNGYVLFLPDCYETVRV